MLRGSNGLTDPGSTSVPSGIFRVYSDVTPVVYPPLTPVPPFETPPSTPIETSDFEV
ncbi:Uncharacterised protein [Mycobacteroides abscessus]|nr:Uncharacterised protein [Mycobacteroides abscessus]